MQIRARGIHTFGYHGPNPLVFTPRRGINIDNSWPNILPMANVSLHVRVIMTLVLALNRLAWGLYVVLIRGLASPKNYMEGKKASWHQGVPLQTWINFNPSMDKSSYPSESVEEITYPFSNWKSASAEDWEWIYNLILHSTGHVIICPCWDETTPGT